MDRVKLCGKDASTAFLTSHDLLRVLKLIPPEVMADSRATAALAAEKPISRLGSGRDCHHLGGIHRTDGFACSAISSAEIQIEPSPINPSATTADP